MTAARGNMQTEATNGGTTAAQLASRPASLPPSGRATPTLRTTDESTLGQPRGMPAVPKNVPEAAAEDEIDDVLEAWGTMDDEGDSFFDAPSSRKPVSHSPTPATFDDGGEPDFAGWLAAQNQAKSKKPTPKGLVKGIGSTATGSRPRMPNRPVSTGIMVAGSGAKKLTTTTNANTKVTAPAKSTHTNSAEPGANEDDWGDAWD